MNKIEILAPAGKLESVCAAVNCGADAVYLGLKELNARTGAQNFDYEDLKNAVQYCNLNQVKVYMALNTVVFDSEIQKVLSAIKLGCDLGVGAFIVQDLGVAKLVKQTAPDMKLHGSTQMSVHTPSGAMFLKKQGFQRVVIAREMSLEEIKQMTGLGIQIECFIHGALCMCVSGQCYMSSMIGTRSANRGQCAQPCRLPFSSKNKGTDYSLSLKDLCGINYIRELEKIGVTCVKIEGRMKRPEYTAAASLAYKAAREGEDPNLDILQAVYSRDGFTDGYIKGVLGESMFGIRQKQDVISASPKILKQVKNSYKNPLQRVGLKIKFELKKDLPSKITIQDDNLNLVVLTGQIPQRAISTEIDSSKLKKALFKLGGTPFYVKDHQLEVDSGLNLPVSELNRLRREACDIIIKQRSRIKSKVFNQSQQIAYKQYKKDPTKFDLWASFESFDQIPFNMEPSLDKIILNIDQIINNIDKITPYKGKIIISPPRVMFGVEKQIISKLKFLKQQGFQIIQALNIAHIEIANSLGLSLVSGFSMNITNSVALTELLECGAEFVVLSPEITLAQAKDLKSQAKKGLLIYGSIPLMITRNCPLNRGCKQCSGAGFLTDRKGIKFRVDCKNGYGCRQVYNSTKLYMADRLKEFEFLDFGVMMFTDENQAECARAIQDYILRVKKSENITRGLYYRGTERQIEELKSR